MLDIFSLATLLHGQNGPSWPCPNEFSKSEGAGFDGYRVLGDKAGLVRCADALSGDTSLFQRSIAAAPQWRFKPYRINGQLIVFESSIEFLFKKNKVKVL